VGPLPGGSPTAPNYLARRRQVLHNVLGYAVTKKRLVVIPLSDPDLHWERPSGAEVDHTVDPRCVGNPRQVEQLLAAVSYVGRSQGPRFIGFFACMYYAMLRPEEVRGLRTQTVISPRKGGEGPRSKRPIRRPASLGRITERSMSYGASSTVPGEQSGRCRFLPTLSG
jgi:hypothetical protein